MDKWKRVLVSLSAGRKPKNVRRRQNFRVPRIEALESRNLLAITVNTTVDEIDGSIIDGDISIRDAIAFANPAGDTIDFSSSLNGLTITLDRVGKGDIDIDQNLTIDASMLSDGITIDADDPSPTSRTGTGIRIFNIVDSTFGANPPLVTLKNLTLTGADISGSGGAISSTAHLALRDCMIVSNEAGLGGGVFVQVDGGTASGGTVLDIQDSHVDDNFASDGGGVYVAFRTYTNRSDAVLISNSEFSHNFADVAGGALWVYDGTAQGNISVQISETTFDDNNEADRGGAIYANLVRTSALLLHESSVTGNSATNGSGGGLYAVVDGSAAVTIEECVVTDNSATRDGGGIFVRAHNDDFILAPTTPTVRISKSLVTGNTAFNRGGGIYTKNFNSTSTLVEDSRVTDNHVVFEAGEYDRNGGGIYAYVWDNSNGAHKPKFTITGSTVDNNEAYQDGGGMFVCAKYNGIFVAVNSTLSGNIAGGGGGLVIARYEQNLETVDAYLRNVTITQNVSAAGGGLMTKDLDDVRVRIANSIISENFAELAKVTPNNLVGRLDIANTKYNLVGSGSTIKNLSGASASLDSTNLNSTNLTLNDTPGLGVLQDNGGPTLTHALVSGSPAIDAGSDALAAVPLSGSPEDELETDQRGAKYPRIVNIATLTNGFSVDIGAYEVGLPKVFDVVLNGVMPNAAAWTRDPYSFAELVTQGKQLAPIFTQGVNKIEVHFSEAVGMLSGSAVTLHGTGSEHGGNITTVIAPTNFSFNTTTHIATLTFSTPLEEDRYRIDIDATAVVGLAGSLDGRWDNFTNDTLYDWTDDLANLPPGHALPSGNGMGGTDFQFMFALNPGDYDQNGIVDGDDFLLWQLESTNPFFDGDGDGIATNGDLSVWEAQVAEYLSFQKFQGDYDRDGAVTPLDWIKWRMDYGMTGTDLDSDGNGNNLVDGADYNLWRNWEDTYGAWHMSSAGMFVGTALVDSTSAPQVVNVTISGSISADADYSFDAHDGSGEQLQTVPIGRADTISITFSEQVNVEASDLNVVGLSTGDTPTLGEFTYDSETMTASWWFIDFTEQNPWMADHFLISLSDAVTDMQGYRLDGEWVNPVSFTTTNSLVSEFPSGDGHAGGNFNFIFTLLPGDADRNNIVNEDDLDVLAGNWQSWGNWEQGDMTGDGEVGWPDDEAVWDHMDLDLTTVHILADLDGDFDVDDDDVETLGGNFGMSSPTWADGDLNGDGYINNADLDLMFAQYGLEIEVVS